MNLSQIIELIVPLSISLLQTVREAVQDAKVSKIESLTKVKVALQTALAQVEAHLTDLDRARQEADAEIDAAGPQ